MALDAFYLDMSNVCWDNIFHFTGAIVAYDTFLSCFAAVYKKHFIYERLERVKGFWKSWMTRELLRKINKKDSLFRKFMRTREEVDLNAFKRFRNALDRELKKSKEMYYFHLFSSPLSKQMFYGTN